MDDPRPGRRLLLFSNSTNHGRQYLEHGEDAILSFLGGIDNLVFVPYALKDWDAYTRIAAVGLGRMGIRVTGVHQIAKSAADHSEAILQARAVFVGGGNSFRLLDGLYTKNLIGVIRARVVEGMPYMGASAGTNVACPTIKTTNDMPIVLPPSFDALNLFPFQVNPHYIDADPNTRHMGETRELRLAEFHEENDTTVIGLREGAWIHVEKGNARLCGSAGAKLFVKGSAPVEWDTATTLDVMPFASL